MLAKVQRQILIPVTLAVIISGCGGGVSKEGRLKTVPAKGVVTLDGKPFGPGTLEFMPTKTSADDRARMASGTVDSEGNFVMGSYEKDDGVVAGEYAVKGLADTGANPSAAISTTAEFKVTVGEQGDENLKIDLKSSGSGPGGLMSRKLGGSGMKPIRP